MVLSCAALNSYEPIRFAGTWKQYSKKAMPQLMAITFQSATLRNFKWPYHANVIKILETVRRRIVRMRAVGSSRDIKFIRCDSCRTHYLFIMRRWLIELPHSILAPFERLCLAHSNLILAAKRDEPPFDKGKS